MKCLNHFFSEESNMKIGNLDFCKRCQLFLLFHDFVFCLTFPHACINNILGIPHSSDHLLKRGRHQKQTQRDKQQMCCGRVRPFLCCVCLFFVALVCFRSRFPFSFLCLFFVPELPCRGSIIMITTTETMHPCMPSTAMVS